MLHVLWQKGTNATWIFRWANVKEGEIVRTPMLGFGDGHYIKVSKKPEDGD